MTILVKVETQEGEESTWMSGITPSEMTILEPLLIEIKNNGGYFPTGRYLVDGDPKPELLYSDYPGWNILKGRLPRPSSGIKQILEIHVFYEDPISLYM